jgi:membrane-associated phospholipid phosphatase
MSVLVAVLLPWWRFLGLPLTDPLQAYLWLWATTVAWRRGLPWREHLRFGRDWLPVLILLELYNLSRGFADNGVSPHVTEPIHADEAMARLVGIPGIPTTWLQRHLYHPHQILWWDVVVSWVYFSHFVATLVIAAVLWLRNRARWGAFMRRWFCLSVAGLATYFAYPMAPPWWAAVHGLTAPIDRISTRGWQAIGLHGTGNVLQLGQLAANPVAAMPSLHAAFALFVVAFFLPSVRRRWWPLLVAYPLAMAFTLVYSGEHYVIDILVGWGYVVAIFVAVGLAERWWSGRRRFGRRG